MKKTTSDLFVSYRYGDDIDNIDIYTLRKEADKVNNTNNDNYQRIFSSDGKRPYKVMTLMDAISLFEERVRR